MKASLRRLGAINAERAALEVALEFAALILLTLASSIGLTTKYKKGREDI